MQNLLLALFASGALAAPAGSGSSASGSAKLSSLGPAPSYSASAAVPSSSDPSAIIKIAAPADIPPKQPTCVSDIFCPGSSILHTVQLAQIFVDSKTFVDRPTNGSAASVVSSWKNLTSSGQITTQQLEDWVEAHFLGEGQDLESATISDFNPQPAFLKNIKDEWLRGWAQIVNGYWRNLARKNIDNKVKGSEGTLIKLNNSFIVAGGRFRESYYWDSKWIIEGLLIGEIKSMAKNMIENFLDEIEYLGIIPNGARKYYLNRSQPPLFTQIVWNYLEKTKDTSILGRALPLLEKEMAFWDHNRTITIKAPKSGRTHKLALYNVTNSAPRPEGYLPDWKTAVGDSSKPVNPPFSASFKARLWSMLASGAESGQDYTGGRWEEEPLLDIVDNNPGLRTLNIDHTVPVDLNAILARNYWLISQMYMMPGHANLGKAKQWSEKAEARKEAVVDLFWDESRLAYYDWNITGSAFGKYLSAASFYPYWAGIFPPSLLASEAKTQKAFAPLAYFMARYPGSLTTTVLNTGLQWDFPNAWPPHVYIFANAVSNIPSYLAKGRFGDYHPKVNFNFMAPGAWGAGLAEADFPSGGSTSSAYGASGNVGNLTQLDKGNWRDGLEAGIAQRYVGSAFCSWYATGGSIPGILPQLPPDQLNATHASGLTGLMFEKFSALSLNQAGVGGEYTVQDGFGWTNGAVAYFTSKLGQKLQRPACPAIQT